LLIEASTPLRVRRLSGEVLLRPGEPVDFPHDEARKLLSRAHGKVRCVDLPLTPLQPGWLVVYRDRRGALCGGCDDRTHGTVDACMWQDSAWMVLLTDGQHLPIASIRSVGSTNAEGHLIAAWTVREHGYDGRREEAAGR
jgi:hypothetical protein